MTTHATAPATINSTGYSIHHSANAWVAVMRAAHAIRPSVGSTHTAWLEAMLARNHGCAYLRRYGTPRTLAAFRAQIPLCTYEDLRDDMAQIAAGASDVLFAGRPVAYEKTGGSSAGSKLIPYTAHGLADFQNNLLPWLADTVQAFHITGRAYFSISPATRQTEAIAGVPVGLPDGAYLGAQAGAALPHLLAVDPEVASISDVPRWKEATVRQLQAAHDLELISVWSPTFLLQLLDAMPDAPACWPRLKLVSCWTHGPAQRYAQALQQRLPHVTMQAKGLLATEGVMTVPWVQPPSQAAHASFASHANAQHAAHAPTADSPCVPAPHGFAEFLQGDTCYLPHELEPGQTYEVVLTTSSGLYRYRTGDRVLCTGHATRPYAPAHTPCPVPALVFMGRDSLHSDLVGEKLTEAFVAHCLRHWPGYAVLVPDAAHAGYVLVAEQHPDDPNHAIAQLEQMLCANPQYAYARRMGQLAPLRLCVQAQASAIVERSLLQRGVRLGDIKPLALRAEAWWLPLLELPSP